MLIMLPINILEGGGARGANQIGVWKALMEYGIKIKAVAGVSVGALNGALMCMGDYEKAVSLWTNISYSSIMNIDDDQMDKLMNRLIIIKNTNYLVLLNIIKLLV